MSCYVGENQLGSVLSYQTRLFQSYHKQNTKNNRKSESSGGQGNKEYYREGTKACTVWNSLLKYKNKNYMMHLGVVCFAIIIYVFKIRYYYLSIKLTNYMYVERDEKTCVVFISICNGIYKGISND